MSSVENQDHGDGGGDDQKRVTLIEVLSILALSVAFSLLITFGSNSNTHDADSLLPAFMSTQKLTWYYWDQNRFANLLPLIASPVRDIAANFYVQTFLRNLAAFWSIVFGLLLVFDRRLFLERFLLGVVVFLLGAPSLAIFGVAVPHAVSCAMFALGLLLIQAHGSKPLALIGAALAFWSAFLVNVSLLIIAIPISFGCLLIGLYGQKTTIGRPISFILITATAATAYLHSSFFDPKTPSSIRYDPKGFSKATTMILEVLNVQFLCGLLFASIAACSFRFFLQRRPASANIPAVDLMLITTVVGTAWLLTNMDWVQTNGFAARYFNVNVMLALAIVTGWSITLLDQAGVLRFRTISVPLLTFIAALCVWRTAGPPVLQIDHVTGVTGAERAFNSEKIALLGDIPSDRPTIIVGNYWYVTPLAFEWNRLHRRLDGYPLADDLSHARAIFPTVKHLFASNTEITIVCVGITEERCANVIRDASSNTARSASIIRSGTVSAGAYRIHGYTPNAP